MSVYLAASPISVAVYSALNVAGFTALCGGGVHDDVPQATTFPFALFDVSVSDLGGFGVRAGSAGMVSQARLRLHVFSTYSGMKEIQAAIAKAKELLRTPPSVTGYRSWDIFHDEYVPIGDEIVNGVKCKEGVLNSRWFVEVA